MPTLAKNSQQNIHVERVPLSKDSKTTSKLDSFFMLPKTLANILESSENELTNLSSAKLFLLSKLNELLPALTVRDREQSIDAINNFVSLWLSSHQAATRLSFEVGCSIKLDCSFVWLPELQNIGLANPAAFLQKWRSNWTRYLNNFDLISSQEGYFVEIQFVQKNTPDNANKPITKKTNSSGTKFGGGVRANELFRALKLCRIELDKIGRAYVKPDFGALNGRPIQGGLPSLGRRR